MSDSCCACFEFLTAPPRSLPPPRGAADSEKEAAGQPTEGGSTASDPLLAAQQKVERAVAASASTAPADSAAAPDAAAAKTAAGGAGESAAKADGETAAISSATTAEREAAAAQILKKEKEEEAAAALEDAEFASALPVAVVPAGVSEATAEGAAPPQQRESSSEAPATKTPSILLPPPPKPSSSISAQGAAGGEVCRMDSLTDHPAPEELQQSAGSKVADAVRADADEDEDDMLLGRDSREEEAKAAAALGGAAVRQRSVVNDDIDSASDSEGAVLKQKEEDESSRKKAGMLAAAGVGATSVAAAATSAMAAVVGGAQEAAAGTATASTVAASNGAGAPSSAPSSSGAPYPKPTASAPTAAPSNRTASTPTPASTQPQKASPGGLGATAASKLREARGADELDPEVGRNLELFLSRTVAWQDVAQEIASHDRLRKSLACLKTIRPQRTIFRVQVPKAYPGVNYRRTKNIEDRYKDFARPGFTVSGQLEDDGNWLRVESNLYLPTRVRGMQLLFPIDGQKLEDLFAAQKDEAPKKGPPALRAEVNAMQPSKAPEKAAQPKPQGIERPASASAGPLGPRAEATAPQTPLVNAQDPLAQGGQTRGNPESVLSRGRAATDRPAGATPLLASSFQATQRLMSDVGQTNPFADDPPESPPVTGGPRGRTVSMPAPQTAQIDQHPLS